MVTPCGSGLVTSLDKSLRLNTGFLPKVGLMLAEAPDSEAVGTSSAVAVVAAESSTRLTPAAKAKADKRGNVSVGNMVEISGIRLVFG